MLKIFDTLSQKNKPLKKTKTFLRLFVCGPTVYDYAHIGHARTYVAFDMVVKYLRNRGYKVNYLQNITDIDDKLIERSREENVEMTGLARKFERAYFEDMAALNITSVDNYERASDYITQIIEQIKLLIERGFAYETTTGVYFRVSKFKEYGKLSGQNLKNLRRAVGIEEDTTKLDSVDFALWKKKKENNEPAWQSPWGDGRPGWHIEDTAITSTVFGGPQYEIHGGARDLIFPHHEAEIAQMESAYGIYPMVDHWMHTGFLRIGGEKMAKSLKNFITIRDILRVYSPETLRVFFTTKLYRSPIDYIENSLKEAEMVERRLAEFWHNIKKHEIGVINQESKKIRRDNKIYKNYIKKFLSELEDDFNTPKAFSELFNMIRAANSELARETLSKNDTKLINSFIREMNGIFGVVNEQKLRGEQIPKNIQKLAERRKKLRTEKKFEEADKVRKEIEQMGYEIKDAPEDMQIKKK